MIAFLLVFLNILMIEIVLSIDNASVLAIIVNKNLSDKKERDKALKYGILGAYVFRGLSLLFVSFILYNPTIGGVCKILGGLYLCHLWYTHATTEVDSVEEGQEPGFLKKLCSYLNLNTFWTTVIMVEFLDMAFSVDNLLAVVSLSSHIWIVVSAVFLGILGMRFVAQYFSHILEKYPSLENSAFIVILLLGLKMLLAGIMDFFPGYKLHELLNAHSTDLIFSVITMSVFLFPIFFNKKQI